MKAYKVTVEREGFEGPTREMVEVRYYLNKEKVNAKVNEYATNKYAEFYDVKVEEITIED